MGFLNIFRRKLNKNAVDKPREVKDFFPSSSGILQKDSTSFACIDRIASEFAGLNFGIFDTKTRQKVKRHSVYALLKEPNKEDRHFNFFYQSAVDYYNGGCYWLKVKAYDEVVSLFRLNPSQVSVDRDFQNKKIYRYNGETYTADEVLFIPSRFDYSTKVGGLSIFSAISSAFETARSIESYTQSSFTNGLIGKRTVVDISGAFPDVTSDQLKELKDNFQSEYAGVNNAFRPLIKRKGIEYSELGGVSADNNTSQLFENRKFQEHEIAKIFGIPEGLLNVSNENSMENTFTLFLEFAIKPLATQFQEAINSLLDEDRFYFEFDYNAIMKVNLQSRIDSYVKQINNGLLSPNEARAKENLEPIEAGDNHFMPAQLMPLNDETINAYMAKQKNEISSNAQSFGEGAMNPTDPDAQHSPAGDDKI